MKAGAGRGFREAWRVVRAEFGAVAASALMVLVIGAPTARAALSPAPYLDTAYNNALWNELLTASWPSGYPASAYYPSVVTTASYAGTLPPLARYLSPLDLTTSYSAGWKITRTSDTVWLQLSGNLGAPYTDSGVLGEDWCGARGGSCHAWSALTASNTSGALVDFRDYYLQAHVPTFTDCHTNTWSFMDGVALDPSGFSGSGAGCEARVVTALQAQYRASASVNVGTLVSFGGSACSSYASQWLSSYGNGTVTWAGSCYLRVWGEGDNVGALVHSLPQPFTGQPVRYATTITTPSESAGLAAARPEITAQGCPVQNEYNASLDATNWAAPDSASCGGPIAASAAETYGPNTCGTQTEPYGFASIAVPVSCGSGEPVNMATGSFYTGSIDASLPGIGVPLAFTRSYNSADATSGPLGPGWTDSFAWSAFLSCFGGTTSCVTVRSGTGQEVRYTSVGGTWVPDAGGLGVLTSLSGGGYKLVDRDQVTYVFDSSGRLTSETDRNGQGLSFAYDTGGNLATATGTGGTMTFGYSGNLLTGISLPDGRSVSYGYTGGLLTSFTDLRGNTVSYTYDSNNRLATIDDQNGHTVVSNTYDPSTGRITGQTDARGHASSFGWTPSSSGSGSGTATYTDANGHTWTQVYVNNTLRSATDPLGNTHTYTYDGALEPIAVTVPRGNTTKMTWDPHGNMLTRTAPAPLSYTEHWTYDTKNDVTGYTDGRGHTTTYGFDTAGNLTSATLPNPTGSGGGPQTTFGRDPTTGLVTSITDPRGKQTTFGYDSAGDLTSVTTPLGYETTYGYDSAGRVTSKVDPRGNITGANPADYTSTYAYDAANHLTSATDPLGNQTQWTYDPVGNLETFTDANTNATSYAYDNANNLTTVTAPDATTTTYAYDNNGNLTGKTDANNHTTTYGYDTANRLASTVKPGGETWTYTYDADNDLATMVDGNGNATHSGGTTTYSYDTLDRLTGISYSGTATPNVTYSYDGDGNRTQMTDGAGTATYSYDNDNRLTGLTRGSQSFAYGYDANSNLTGETYPDSTAITYAYTNDEQLASVASGGNTTSYSYDPAGNLLTTALPSGNGYTQTLTYDKAGRLTDVSNANANGSATLSAFAYTLDPVASPTEVDQTGATSSTTTYSYDTLNRLSSATVDGATTSWTYDGVGNRLTQTTPSGTTNYTYNADDELAAADTSSYSYDANGNQTAAGSNTYSYDLADRLVSATVGSTTTAYGYDGDGSRLIANDGTNTTKYLWDPLSLIPQLDVEQNGSGTDLRSYLYGAGPVSMTTGGSTYYYHSDGLASIANLTDSTGNPQWTYSYDAWGNPAATQDASGAPPNPIQFTAGYTDATGLDLFGAREYDPNTGRFLTTDPAGLAAGSTYVYADDQPSAEIDPFGLWGFNPFSPFQQLANGFLGATNTIGNAVANFGPTSALLAAANTAGDILGTRWYAFSTQHPCISNAIIIGVVTIATDGIGDAALAADAAEEGAALEATPAERVYSAHYLNETGPVRNIPGSVVDETIDHGQVVEKLADRTVYYDAKNDVTVVQSETTGKIMSVRRGAP